MSVEPVAPGERLRIAVLADFEGPHARSWLRWFVARGHDVHAISFYPPAAPIEGATVHALRQRRAATSGERTQIAGAGPPVRPSSSARRSLMARAGARAPRGVLRLVHGIRYRAAGLRRVVRDVAPDVFHAHYLVEHGFYGALAGVRPYVVTAWGSDALVEPARDWLSRRIARWTVGRADLVTSNNAYMSQRIVELGAPATKVATVTLGAERYDLDRAEASVNRAPHDPKRTPVIVSTRAHEPLYNIDDIMDAHASLTRDGVDARLVVAHSGALTESLRARAAAARGAVQFTGTLDRAAFRDLLADAEVFVSVPSSDATSVALLQAMAAGAFPVVSDLPTQHEWVEDGVNGFRVPLHRPDVLAERIRAALADGDLRRRAADANLRMVEQRGLNEVSLLRMETLYREVIAARAFGRR